MSPECNMCGVNVALSGRMHGRCRHTPYPVTLDWRPGDDYRAYKCLDVDEDGYLTTLDSDGNKSADLRLPEFAPDAKKVSERIEAYLAAEKDFNVIVLSACGKRQVVDTRFIGEGLVK